MEMYGFWIGVWSMKVYFASSLLVPTAFATHMAISQTSHARVQATHTSAEEWQWTESSTLMECSLLTLLWGGCGMAYMADTLLFYQIMVGVWGAAQRICTRGWPPRKTDLTKVPFKDEFDRTCTYIYTYTYTYTRLKRPISPRCPSRTSSTGRCPLYMTLYIIHNVIHIHIGALQGRVRPGAAHCCAELWWHARLAGRPSWDRARVA